MKLQYIGLIDNQFKYKVTINNQTFDFHTGIGWNSKKRLGNNYKRLTPDEAKTVLIAESKYNRMLSYNDFNLMPLWRREPSETDVLECLKSDCEAGNMSFTEFCDTFGYSDDSIKALDVYRQCMDTAKKMRGFKFPESLENEVQS